MVDKIIDNQAKCLLIKCWILGGANPFQNIEKTTVLQEARTFNDTPVNPRKCTHILTKILYLLNQVGTQVKYCLNICAKYLACTITYY